MAGTDRSRSAGHAGAEGGFGILPGPAFVLVRPQLGENIGASARAMLNCRQGELRLVAPRDGWPSETAQRNAAGADVVIDRAALHDDLAPAIADCQHVYATTARRRDLVKRLVTPRAAAADIRAAIAAGERVAVLFGPERSGLTNDEVALADTVIEAPLNPGFSSLNLAQAVLLVAWELMIAGETAPDRQLSTGAAPGARGPGHRRASAAQLGYLFEHLEGELDRCGFLALPDKRPGMVRNIRSLFLRADLTEQEVQTLRGIIKCLARSDETASDETAQGP